MSKQCPWYLILGGVKSVRWSCLSSCNTGPCFQLMGSPSYNNSTIRCCQRQMLVEPRAQYPLFIKRKSKKFGQYLERDEDKFQRMGQELLQIYLCRHEVHYGCLREDKCFYAHSLVELKVWIMQKETGMFHRMLILLFILFCCFLSTPESSNLGKVRWLPVCWNLS